MTQEIGKKEKLVKIHKNNKIKWPNTVKYGPGNKINT